MLLPQPRAYPFGFIPAGKKIAWKGSYQRPNNTHTYARTRSLPFFPPPPFFVGAWCSCVRCKPREEVVQARPSPDPPPTLGLVLGVRLVDFLPHGRVG